MTQPDHEADLNWLWWAQSTIDAEKSLYYHPIGQ